jgi:hypothetical protein
MSLNFCGAKLLVFSDRYVISSLTLFPKFNILCWI